MTAIAMKTPPIVSAQEWEDSPEGYPQTPPYKWWNWHDEYAADTSDPRWSEVVEASLALQSGDDRVLDPTATDEKPRETGGSRKHEEGA